MCGEQVDFFLYLDEKKEEKFKILADTILYYAYYFCTFNKRRFGLN